MTRPALVACLMTAIAGCGDSNAASAGDPDADVGLGADAATDSGSLADADASEGAVDRDADGGSTPCRVVGGGSATPFPGPNQCAVAPSGAGVMRYVDASAGSDVGNDGAVASKPLKTIGRALSVAKAGDVLLLQSGTYRERIDYTGPGGTKDAPLTLRAAPGATPIVSGSVVVKGFAATTDANVYALPYSETALLDGEPVGVPQQVFVSGAPLRQIGPSVAHPTCTGSSGAGPCIEAFGVSHADVVAHAGTFFFDTTKHELQVHLADGGNPAAHEIEVSVRRRVLFLGLGSQYVCVEGLTLHHSNGTGLKDGQQEQGVFVGASSTIANSIVEYMDFIGLGLGYDEDAPRASYVIARNNGDSGMSAAGSTHVIVEHSQLRGNNQRRFNVLWHAGGIKMASGKTTATVRDNVFDHNVGPGMWCDFCGGGELRIERNVFIGNTREAQVFVEVSDGATVQNNLLIGDFTDPDARAIFIRESRDARVLFNTIVRLTPSVGIDVFGGPRGAADNASLLGNTIASLASSGATIDLRFGSATGPSGITGLKSDGNLFFNSTGKYAFVYGATSTTLADWQKGGFDGASLVADPKFVGGSDYSLAKGSPAIDRVTQTLVKDDHDGSARPKGPKSDVGAFERCVE